MKRLAIVVVAALVILLVVSLRADASPKCGLRAAMVDNLKRKFGEAPVAIGPTVGAKHVVEIFASLKGRTWTALISRPDGMACVVAVGTDWQQINNKGDDV